MSTTSPSTAISVEGLSKTRGKETLWADVTFTVEAGSALAVTGPSGAGKSTLLNCVGLLEKPDAGTIDLDGVSTRRISRSTRRRLFRSTIGHLFQNYGLVESWTVDGNLDVAFVGRGLDRRLRRDRRRAALERVGLTGLGTRRVYSLSGGEQQRIALARLLLKNPTVVLADEPSAALDHDNAAVVLSVLAELRHGGSAIVVATHDDVVTEWCDDRIELARGRTVW
ncbi:ATP-binding cassette domain-containing protein [Frondihabitans sp. 762G35]|uniref:ATP-binding cassette domain-containing protein n=1 Tax=Frondihabitans sp. 762G35 TaxID=1446794 RepID=UPI001C2010E2|nr:ATP-binding cassette domain-containing protein [Frondihabitans sp. 762G35]